MRLVSMIGLTIQLSCAEKPEDSDDAQPLSQISEGDTQGDCEDGIDNDDDGYIDCEDQGCDNRPACTVPEHGTYDYLAFDGERTWKYQSVDEEMPYTLVVEKTAYEYTDGMEYITFEYSTENPQQLLGSVSWAAGGINGSGITGYSLNDEETTFDTMIGFAEDRMVGGDTVGTTTNGATFTSTMLGLEPCPNNWSPDDWECLHFSLEVDQTDQDFPFLGDYWMANGWGASRFNAPTGAWSSAEDWVLIGAEWDISE